MCSYLCPGKGHMVVPALVVCWHAGSACLSLLAMFLGLYSRHVPSAALMSPGTPMAKPVRDRGWQSAWWCGALSSRVPSRAAAMAPPGCQAPHRTEDSNANSSVHTRNPMIATPFDCSKPCVPKAQGCGACSPLLVGGWHVPTWAGSPAVGPRDGPCPLLATALALVGKAGMEPSLPP